MARWTAAIATEDATSQPSQPPFASSPNLPSASAIQLFRTVTDTGLGSLARPLLLRPSLAANDDHTEAAMDDLGDDCWENGCCATDDNTSEEPLQIGVRSTGR